MSLLSDLSKIPTVAWPLGVGLLVTSPIFFGNIGLSLVGPLPIIKEEIGASGLSKREKVRVWSLFYKGATPYIVGGTILTTILHAFAALTAPNHQVRNLSIVSAVSSISILPWTVIAILPINNALLALDEKKELTTQDEGNAMNLVKEWDWRHKVRYIGYGAGWVSGLAALLVVVRNA